RYSRPPQPSPANPVSSYLRVAQIPAYVVERLREDCPSIAQAFRWNDLVNASIQNEWLLNIGQRSAYERLGHLLVELFCRLRTAGLVNGESCDLPLTQNDLADATGLTSVHVNRTLMDFRRQGLVELERRRLRLPDMPAMMAATGFNPLYLHLDHESRDIDAYA
ncbi:Crp/Fnr family transcriptional regulator, partial [uncultured Sphingomonas sp.]|uniref:Crp/Fnr family transcriptional regulator n=1 Tax=uncultured Sphingomonas sp. TaxID=158754 RepID=UPI0035CC6F75